MIAESTSLADNTHPAPTGRVLFVDDHAQARASMADILRQAGHSVDACSSAARPCSRWRRKATTSSSPT